ncbi:MAG: hypothetical protein LBH10_03350 [Burkholderiaceae bacterium]|nr:hypothetical protein [Burkholderiaceae bacterium]
MRILLIEDAAAIGDGLRVGLSRLGFTVDWFTDGQTSLDVLAQWHRQERDEPVLILTARDTLDERLLQGESGGRTACTGRRPHRISPLPASGEGQGASRHCR